MPNKKKYGLVWSRFNEPVTSKLRDGAIAAFEKHNAADDYVVVEVPGAYEIPLAAKWLMETGCEAVATVGAVIQGETAHFDYVCSSVERGCTQLQLEAGKPVVFGVITTNTSEQAFDRAGGKKGNKGEHAVDTLFEMLTIKKNLL